MLTTSKHVRSVCSFLRHIRTGKPDTKIIIFKQPRSSGIMQSNQYQLLSGLLDLQESLNYKITTYFVNTINYTTTKNVHLVLRFYGTIHSRQLSSVSILSDYAKHQRTSYPLRVVLGDNRPSNDRLRRGHLAINGIYIVACRTFKHEIALPHFHSAGVFGKNILF